MDFQSIAKILKVIAPIILGCAIGIGLTSIWLLQAELALNSGVIAGAVSGFGAFLFFLLVRATITQSKPKPSDNSSNNTGYLSYSFVKGFLPKGDDAEQRAKEIVEIAQNTIKAGISYWSAAVAVGFGLTAAGAAVAMVTALAAIRQVERIDSQNRLIELQIFEAKASRISATFSAQLPSLIEQIYAEKSGQATWSPSPELAARIQTVIDLAEPYMVDSLADEMINRLRDKAFRHHADGAIDESHLSQAISFLGEDRVFSKERGQLLQLLVASGMNFEALPRPLKFAHAYLRRVELRSPEGPEQQYSLGQTELHYANLYEIYTDIDFSSTSLYGAILPSAEELGPFIVEKNPNAVGLFERFSTPDITHAILPSNLIELFQEVAKSDAHWIIPPLSEASDLNLSCEIGQFSSIGPFYNFDGYRSNEDILFEHGILFHWFKWLRSGTACGPVVHFLSDSEGSIYYD